MTKEKLPLTSFDLKQSIEIVWQALAGYRGNLIPEGDSNYDEEWNDICTAMGWIQEALGCEELPDEEV